MCIRSFHVVPLVSLGMVLASWAGAETTLEVAFDDPQGILAPQAEGITQTDPAQLTVKGENLTSSLRAKAVPVWYWNQKSGDNRWQRAQILSEPGIGSFLRMAQRWDAGNNSAYVGVEIVPKGEVASLAALSGMENGKLTINGGLDCFIRFQREPGKDSGEWKILEVGSPKSLGVRVASYGRRGMGLSFTRGGTPVIDADLDGTPEAGSMTNKDHMDPDKVIEPGKFYHLALDLRTDAEGVITARLFLQAGTGAIDTAKADAQCAELKFRVIAPASQVTSILPNGKVLFGTFSAKAEAGATDMVDLARFRIFKPGPAVFPGLEK